MKKLQLLGEFDCKIDAKGRMRVPTDLIKQLDGEASKSIVINRGFEDNLVLYPKSVWDRMSQEVDQLNPYDPKNRKFIRYFYRGAQILELDGSDRLLIKKPLLEFAKVKNEVKLFARGETIEVWSTELYNELITEEPMEDFSSIAYDVMVKSRQEKTEE